MICRSCLRQASGLTSRQFTAITSQITARTTPRIPQAFFSTTFHARNAAATAAAPELTPLNAEPAAEKAAALSSCPAGTVLNGLNYYKGKTDPVALPDDQYPDWLWKCVEVGQKRSDDADADAGDAYSKSKKQRRLAAKRQKQLEAKLMASGDLEALAPKIPIQKQTINLPGAETGEVKEALLAADKRQELRRAMRKERRAAIKESNYLKTM
ncbi:mitochondrial ribosomal protein L37-domain-containing protein [Triangularia verruculosa]|uniref:Large ribosomal subunit protein mL54 n=1 Tax=Triangularia verruculosa TaxID=2587418 RepID=A0AAN7AW71_9PEZI|nr:mitochondrial ribosomal protein L37-domain-containing protein [Triangularia verruculosa]